MTTPSKETPSKESTAAGALPALLAGLAVAGLSWGVADALPTRSPHPHDRDSIAWEKDGSRDGSTTHNHRSNRDFGGDGIPQEPFTAFQCWDDEFTRLDTLGTFDGGHCFIDEAMGSDPTPDYYFVGSGWPAEAQARIREAFAAWSAVTSDRDDLLTGIEFEETATESDAEIRIFWVDLDDRSGGGQWIDGLRELRFDSSFTWYFQADPTGIPNGSWHFYSVALHEVGHAVAFDHQLDADDVMTAPVGLPPEDPGHRYFMALDPDSITGVRDLYSQPHRRIAFVIDDTGSMGGEIGLVKTTVRQKVDEFVAENLLLDYHLLTYKDDVTYRGHTTDPAQIKSWVDGLTATGGGDCPEEMLGALSRIADESPHSDAWVMTDAGFHGGPGDVAATIFKLISRRVKVHPIIYSLCFGRGGPAEGQGGGGGPALGASLAGGAKPGGEGGDETGAEAPPEGGAGPESLVQLATQTGGHLFRISTSETQGAASILLNEMISDAELTLVEDVVSTGSPKVFEVRVDATGTETSFLLNGLSGDVALLLTDPTGTVVGAGDPGVTYTALSNSEYYQVASPLPGLWHAEVSGNGDFTFSASGRSPLVFEYLSDTSLALGEPAQVLASLSGDVESVAFSLRTLTGDLVAVLGLKDDGEHGDGSAGDGVFGGIYKPTSPGVLRIHAQGTVSGVAGSATFDRVAPEAIRVQTLQVLGPDLALVNRGDSLIHTFEIRNLGAATETFDLTASEELGWADLSGLPATIAVGAGGSVSIDVPVSVPANAPPGALDEIVLVAVARSDPFLSDAASAFTRMRLLLLSAEP